MGKIKEVLHDEIEAAQRAESLQPFKVIIEGKYQKLQTGRGDNICLIISTLVYQDVRHESWCIFEAYVNADKTMDINGDLLFYDKAGKYVYLKSGEVLELDNVEFIPKTGNEAYDRIKVKCNVIFPYQTNHK